MAIRNPAEPNLDGPTLLGEAGRLEVEDGEVLDAGFRHPEKVVHLERLGNVPMKRDNAFGRQSALNAINGRQPSMRGFRRAAES